MLIEVSFLEEEEVIRFGPDPILHLLPKGGNIGKAQVDLIIVRLLFLGRRALLSNIVDLHLIIGIKDEPELDDFFPMLLRQVTERFWEAIVIHQPVCIVNSMNGHVVSTVMRFPLMHHHCQDAIIGLGDRNAIIGVGKEDFGGDVELPVMFRPLLLHEFKSLKMKDDAVRLTIQILTIGFICPCVEQGLKVNFVVPRREDDVEWDLFSFFKDAIGSDMKEFATDGNWLRDRPHVSHKVSDVSLDSMIKVSPNVMELRDFSQRGRLRGAKKGPEGLM